MDQIRWPVIGARQVASKEFVRFWEQLYSGYDEEFYRKNIGKPLTQDESPIGSNGRMARPSQKTSQRPFAAISPHGAHQTRCQRRLADSRFAPHVTPAMEE